MKGNSYTRTDCRLCHSTRLKLVLPLTPSPLPDAYIKENDLAKKQLVFPLYLMLCTSCGHTQLGEVVNPKIIYKDYLYETVSSLGLSKHFDNYASEVLARVKCPKESFVIDIGSNDGTLLKSFKNRGMRVLGIDPAEEIAKAATGAGVETLPDFFPNPKLTKKIVNNFGKAQIITVNNLFANVDDLDTFVNGVSEILADDGVFVMESFYLPNLIKNIVFDFIYHEHLSSFSVRPLQKFFSRFGMELFDVEHVWTKGGSMRYFVQMTKGKRKISATLKKYLSLEKKSGLHNGRLFAKFLEKIQQKKKQLIKVLDKLHKQGKIIAGYGASATSTTLIYHYNLAGYLQFLIDDYGRKQNTFSPGVHIPVISSTDAWKKKPVAVVILAWRYADPIIAKNKDFLESGGTFIIPLPKLKIIQGSKKS